MSTAKHIIQPVIKQVQLSVTSSVRINRLVCSHISVGVSEIWPQAPGGFEIIKFSATLINVNITYTSTYQGCK